ncbi:MAG: metallophosphoesterase family protein, partial [Muribaculaceae bacterium]|nr:metallophosphoesterase family protein [Muribaculaceae bacterium]
NIDHGEVARLCPELSVFTVDDVKVLLTHVGGYPGRYAPGIERMLSDEKINLMVCGHSHILKVIPDKKLNLLHVNPGAAGYHGWQKFRTLVRLSIDKGSITDLEVIHL